MVPKTHTSDAFKSSNFPNMSMLFLQRSSENIHTYIHTYLPTYLRTYVRTYIHTYLPTYLPTYIHTYIHTYMYHHLGCQQSAPRIFAFLESRDSKLNSFICHYWEGMTTQIMISSLIDINFVSFHQSHQRDLDVYIENPSSKAMDPA